MRHRLICQVFSPTDLGDRGVRHGVSLHDHEAYDGGLTLPQLSFLGAASLAWK